MILAVFLSVQLFLSPLFSTLFQSVRFCRAENAPAAGSYACVLDTVFFCAEPDERRGLFLIPKTYYVKILEYGTSYSKIEYLYDDSHAEKLVGYARSDGLTFVDYVPTRPYLYCLFDVNYVIDGNQIQDSSFLNQITVTCVYYGDYHIGAKTYCYVLRGDTFGYIPKPDSLFYKENPEYAERLEQALPTPTPDSQTPKAHSSPTQIALLIVLCLLVPILAALILKPPKRPPYESEEV